MEGAMIDAKLFDSITRALSTHASRRKLFGGLTAAFPFGMTGQLGLDRSSVKQFPTAAQESIRIGATPSVGLRTPDRTFNDSLSAAYEDVASLHRNASVQLVDLESTIADLSNGQQVSKREAWLAKESGLQELDVSVNSGLTDLYARAAASGDPESDRVLVRTALLHWVAILRRMAMRSFHTQVDGLVDDLNCSGDLVGDDFLLDYFDALFLKRPSEEYEAEVAAVRSLAALARQSACLGQQQSALFASYLYWSFVELRGFLRLNGLERLVPFVVQAAMAPLLLFYDVEKYRGFASPLSRWFVENHGALEEGIKTQRLPTLWHALWLYDRRTGHLIGYRPVKNPGDENDVALSSFLGSVVSRENLGTFECSLAEMIERGAGPLGYLCRGSSCGTDPRISSTVTEGQARWFATRPSLAGLTVESTQSAGCSQPSKSGSSDRCANGLQAGGRTRIAESIGCLTEQIIQPGDREMRCLAEAMGLCGDPLHLATKALQETSFSGIRIGKQCQLGQDAGTETDEVLEEKKRQVEAAEINFDAAWDEYGLKVAAADAAKQKADAAFTAETAAILKYRDEPTDENRDKVTEARNTFFAADQERTTKENEERYSLGVLEARGDTLKALYENLRQHRPGAGMCPWDTPDCGTNACGAMSAAAQQTLKCITELADPSAGSPLKQVGVIDPSPLDDPVNPTWANCFRTLEAVTSAARACWMVQCGPGQLTVQTPQETCACIQVTENDRPLDSLDGLCAETDCAEGHVPTSRDGITCACIPIEGADEGTPGGPVPFGPMLPTAPRTFTETRKGELPELGDPMLPWP
jgi:hypothetical protein